MVVDMLAPIATLATMMIAAAIELAMSQPKLVFNMIDPPLDRSR